MHLSEDINYTIFFNRSKVYNKNHATVKEGRTNNGCQSHLKMSVLLAELKPIEGFILI